MFLASLNLVRFVFGCRLSEKALSPENTMNSEVEEMGSYWKSDAQAPLLAIIGLIFLLGGVLGLVYAGDLVGKIVSLIVLFIGLLMIPGVGTTVGSATARGLGLIFTGPGILVMIAFLVLLLVVLHLGGYW